MPRPALKLSTIDLNLLVMFDAMLREKSVTRAGLALGLSQPAMSHALTRLRHMLKDDLFVRGPKGMIATPRAEQLADPIRIALEGLRRSLEPVHFDPSQATRTFHIAVDNYSAIVLVAPIVARIAAIAPAVRLDFRPSGTLDIPDMLDRSELDLAIGLKAAQGERFSTKSLLRDRFVVVYRNGHPAARATLSAERLATLQKLEISSAQFGVEFAVAIAAKPAPLPTMRVPFLSAAQVLATSDMVAVLPLNVARNVTTNRELSFSALTAKHKAIDASMSWARRLDNQPAHQWLREAIEAATR
jgi:DNA-binding transcriptional LysR family regulator